MLSPSTFTSIINSYLPEPHASLLNGILFGVSLKTTKAFYEQLKMVGLLHIVVLSGMNITFLSAVITNITGFLSRRVSFLLTILIIILFIIFVGPQAPIVRAGFMGILTSVAILSGRKNLVLYSLFLSAIFIALFWPKWLTTISFQLSYGATLGIILFGRVKSLSPPPKSQRKEKVKNFLREAWYVFWKEFKPSLAAQVFTAPIIFLYFKQISLISPLANVLVSFTIVPLMIFGFLTAILGKINFYLGFLPAWICYLFLSYIIFIVETLTKIPGIFIKF
ncbi:MAG: ComEC/Rec2 family competence protein [Microgenomates group bacterium]